MKDVSCLIRLGYEFQAVEIYILLCVRAEPGLELETRRPRTRLESCSVKLGLESDSCISA